MKIIIVVMSATGKKQMMMMSKEEKIIKEHKRFAEKQKEMYELQRIRTISLENRVKEALEENKSLKDKLDKNTEIYLNASKYGSEMEGKVVVLEYILEELKKWLEEIKEDRKYANDVYRFTAYDNVLKKIKELEKYVK